MKHYTRDEWACYVRDELDETTRNEYENHLYQCDECLEIYLFAVEEHEAFMPQIADTSEFTQSIMDQIDAPKVKSRKPTYRNTIWHYGIAVAMTLILMSSGLFNQLMNMANSFENDQKQESFVFSIMNNSDSITDQWKESLKEGKHNE